MTRHAFARIGLLLALAALACATTAAPPAASQALDWTAVAGEEVPEIVTLDADGQERVTKIWVVVVDGQGYVRTGNTRWFRNVERDPDVTLRIGDGSWPLRAVPVEDPELQSRILAAFRAKYGFQDRLTGLFRALGEPNLMRLEPRA